MKTSDFKKRIANLDDDYYDKGELHAEYDIDGNVIVTDRFLEDAVDDPLVRINSNKTDSFAFNPKDDNDSLKITDGLYALVRDYASTKIQDRGTHGDYDNYKAEIEKKIDKINSLIRVLNAMSNLGKDCISKIGDNCFVMKPDISEMIDDSIKNQDCTLFNAINKEPNKITRELEKKRYQDIVDKLFIDMGIIKSKKPRWFD